MHQSLQQLKLNLDMARHSLQQHQTRNMLTGFGVAWGIFILIILVGAGQGLQEGVMRIFGNYAQNSLWFYGGYTESGNGTRKPVVFDYSLIADLKQVFPEIEAISAEKSISGLLVGTDRHSAMFNVTATDVDYFSIKLLGLSAGRSFNVLDKEMGRKVAIIGERVAEELFPNEPALGKFIQIRGAWFMIIGQLRPGSVFEQGDQGKVFIPFQSLRETIHPDGTFSEVGMVLAPQADLSYFETAIKNYLARRYHFSPTDTQAMYVFNRKEQVKAFNSLFGAIQAFLWAIGISLLLTGMVGISNTMIIVVKERTKEIGIRKSLGAKGRQVLFMILTESVAITLLAGIVGLLLGMLFVFLVNLFLGASPDDNSVVIQGMSVNFSIAAAAIIILILSGGLAGWFPARKAAGITPVEAMNYETN